MLGASRHVSSVDKKVLGKNDNSGSVGQELGTQLKPWSHVWRSQLATLHPSDSKLQAKLRRGGARTGMNWMVFLDRSMQRTISSVSQ